MNLDSLTRDLELAGCEPRELGIGSGIWIACCPTCKLAGRRSQLEIRASGVVTCASAHGLYDSRGPFGVRAGGRRSAA